VKDATETGNQLPPVYDPAAVEPDIYELWLRGDAFRAEAGSGRPPFTIVIPPPNVTGSLHLGHALDNSLQDAIIRWRRMAGDEALWLPGTDHAGIATQHVVEERLAKEGLSRQGLGREAFGERVWAWKEEYEEIILHQLRRLGASCDWSRLRFTMDEGCSRAVREVFVSLWERGLIYRGDYIINWCPDCRTALSDIEVEHEEVVAHLWTVHYPLEDGGMLPVVTTRPETIPGDTGLAVNPDDERYQQFHGRVARHPLLDRMLPVVADSAVRQGFGTGVVKVTPAHDPVDFEIAQRHGLPSPVIMDEGGRMTAAAGPYQDLDRRACREKVLADLQARDLLGRVEEYRHAIGHCYRCASPVEPLLSRQWFVRMRPLAGPAAAAVERGELKFVPDRFARVYLEWLAGIRDWCISRQLWWGHRIPAWHCRQCGQVIVSRSTPETCGACGERDPEQDPDVLDTWFSSALWPFSTLGWPDATADLGYFFPTSVLVTGYDIIFFWVARMAFMSLEFTGKLPFHRVLIHGLVRDAHGRKMSKSKGTGVDLLEAVDRYGADALRFSLLVGNAPGNDMRFHWERVEYGRNFANKLWNAARFALMNLGDFEVSVLEAPVELADRWILARLRRTIGDTDRLLDRLELGEAGRRLEDFAWGELCDWYIELAKARLHGHDPDARRRAQLTLWRSLSATLALLHPFLPFVTEAIWQHWPGREGLLCRAPWPNPGDYPADDEAEGTMTPIMEAIRAIRTIRSEFNVPPASRATAWLVAADEGVACALEAGREYLAGLAGLEKLTIVREAISPPGASAAAVIRGAEIHVPLRDLIDFDHERNRLRRQLASMTRDRERSQHKLADPQFLNRAPAEVVAREREREQEAAARVEKLERYLRTLG